MDEKPKSWIKNPKHFVQLLVAVIVGLSTIIAALISLCQNSEKQVPKPIQKIKKTDQGLRSETGETVGTQLGTKEWPQKLLSELEYIKKFNEQKELIAIRDSLKQVLDEKNDIVESLDDFNQKTKR